MEREQTRVAVIGCGMIGQLYCRTLQRLGARVLATADPLLARAEAAARLVGGRAFADYAELLDTVEVDLVCVCSPTPFHYEATLAAAAHRRHVFLEKPMAETLPQAREMLRACDDAGCVLGVGFKMRFESVFAHARERIAAGLIGQPRYAHVSFVQPVPPAERIWYVDVGVTRDMAVHPLDFTTWWMGAMPTAVRAQTERRLGRKGEDAAFFELRFDEGRRVTLQCGYIPGYPEIAGSDDITFQIIGEKGYLLGKRPDLLLSVTDAGIQRYDITPVDAFEAELAAFLDALVARRPPPVSGAEGVTAQAIIEAALASAASGEVKPVSAEWSGQVPSASIPTP